MNDRELKQDNVPLAQRLGPDATGVDKAGADKAGEAQGGGGQAGVAGAEQQKRRAAPCPVCSKPETPPHQPFCSARCADIDLNRWLTGSYAIPGRPVEDEETE